MAAHRTPFGRIDPERASGRRTPGPRVASARHHDPIRPAVVPVLGRIARLTLARLDPRADRQFASRCNRELMLQAAWDELRAWREQVA